MEKRCSKCELTKPFSEFTKNKNRNDGLTVWCKSCCKKSRDDYYEKNKDRLKPVRKKWRIENKEYLKLSKKLKRKEDPRKVMLYSAKCRAKSKGLPFDLELEDIVIPDVCPVFGVEFDFETSVQTRYSPSLDRIVPEKGYVKGNVQVISWQANTMKNNANDNELLLFAEWITKQLKGKDGR